ncbi:MAG: hypothetical protein K8L99_17695 [Anaerolineae bacterium]|nr:hypothetical protein [Anaerolineae bacterium]
MNSKRESASIRIISGSKPYAQQIEELQSLVYEVNAADYDDCITAEKFRRYLEIFPEGQFLALNTATDQVVGVTTSMRIHFDVNRPMVEPWVKTTGFG